MKACIRAVLLLLVILVAACKPSNKSATDEFVVEYVESILEGSAFYKKYSTEHDLELIELARPKMTRKFVISGWDYVAPGAAEYAISFSNGALAVVAVDERDGVVESATLTVARQPNSP